MAGIDHKIQSSNGIHTPVARTAFSYKTIKFKGVSIYNNISARINTTCSIAALKAKLKQLLLRGDTF